MMVANTTIHNVTLLGADGTLGAYILPQLLKGKFKVTVLKRAGSKSPDNYPNEVEVKKVSDDFPHDELVKVLKGQDAVVLSIKGSQIDIQKRIADASIEAGVKRLIPADFGSCDSSTARAQELVPLFKRKTELRDYLTELSNKHANFTWTALVAGHLFDWLEFMKIDVDNKKISVLNDGEMRASYSTRDRVGEATRHVLERPDTTANKTLFVQSFLVTQNEVTAAFEKATGSTWEVEKLVPAEYERQEVIKRDQGDTQAIENLVWLLGVVDGVWPKKPGFAMDLLELKDQDLNAVVSELVQKHKNERS